MPTQIKKSFGLKDKNYVLEQVLKENNDDILNYLNSDLQNNKAFLMELVISNGAQFLDVVPEHIQCDSDFATTVVFQNARIFCMLPDSVKDNPDIVKNVIQSSANNFIHASERLRLDLNFVREAIQIEPLIYTSLNSKLRADPFCIDCFLSESPKNITHISERHVTKEHCLKVVKPNGYNFKYIPKAFSYDIDVIKAAITSEKPMKLYQLPEDLANKKEIALFYLDSVENAVTSYFGSVETAVTSYFGSELCDDYDVMFRAIQKNVVSYKDCSERLQQTYEIMQLALQKIQAQPRDDIRRIVISQINNATQQQVAKSHHSSSNLLSIVEGLMAEKLYAELKKDTPNHAKTENPEFKKPVDCPEFKSAQS